MHIKHTRTYKHIATLPPLPHQHKHTQAHNSHWAEHFGAMCAKKGRRLYAQAFDTETSLVCYLASCADPF